MSYTKTNNYGLGNDYMTVGCALPRKRIEQIDQLVKQEGLFRSQLLRKWMLERLEHEAVINDWKNTENERKIPLMTFLND